MTNNKALQRFSLLLLVVLPLLAIATPLRADGTLPEEEPTATETAQKSEQAEKNAAIKKQLFHGQVILLEEAFKKRGIKPSDKEHAKQVVLETAKGELIPIVADWRGRAFYQDERLRNRPVDLVGYRQEGVPFLQVLMIFTYNKQGEREYMDYWCDICSIPMYEIKPCDCCQDKIRLRFQPRKLPSYIDVSETISSTKRPTDDKPKSKTEK